MSNLKLASFGCAVLLACSLEAQPPGFTRDVQPILTARCGACHGGDKRSGGFTIREYTEMLHGGRSGASILPRQAAQSLLVQRITGERGPTMPLAAPPLPAQEIALIRSWIDTGARLTPDGPEAKAPWKPTLELTAPPVPTATQTHSQHPIDRFLAQQGPTPLPVSDRIFARRAYLDLWGLLPSPEQLDAFIQDRDPKKRDKLIDTLLANNRNYAEHWISFWNDLLRNDGGDSYHGGRKSITDWLFAALQSNQPYNGFVSDLLNPAKPGAPDGFLLGVNWRGDVNASQLPVMQAAQNSAQVFLGINLKCNSCHDSFISSWKLKDAYGLAAYFAEQPKLELVRCDNPTGQFTAPSFLYPELNAKLNPGAVPESLNERRATVAKLFTDPHNGRTPRTLVNRYWQRLLGRGIVLDVDDLDGEPWNPQLLDWLASDFVSHGYDLKHLLRTIMTSQAYQLPSMPRASNDDKGYVFRGPELRRITAEQFMDAVGSVTGEWEIAPDPATKSAMYSRDWRIQSTTLSRALGRPIRDQVFTERDCSATTLQSLELVNGSVLTGILNRGAKRMLGQLQTPPENLFDSGRVSAKPVPVEVDISRLNELHLVVADVDSYSPERVVPLWSNATVLDKGGKWIPLGKSPTISTFIGSDEVFDIRAKGYTRFRAEAGVDPKCVQSDISPSVRFFVFGEKPDKEHLVRVPPATPVPTREAPKDKDQLVMRIWLQSLGRAPTTPERKLALESLSEPGGLADLLWSIFMLPEFQLIG